MRTVVISIGVHSDLQNKIAAIKGVRGLCGLGLKEAKDMVERIAPHHAETVHIRHDVLEPMFSDYVRQIRESGLTIQVIHEDSAARKGIAEEIRRLVTFATMSAQYDIGKALLDVMETYCPQPADEYLKGLEKDDTDNERE